MESSKGVFRGSFELPLPTLKMNPPSQRIEGSNPIRKE